MSKPAHAYIQKVLKDNFDKYCQREMDKQIELEKAPTGEQMKVYMETARDTKNATNMWAWWKSLKVRAPKSVTFIHDSIPRFFVRQFTKFGTNHILFSSLMTCAVYFYVGRLQNGWDDLKKSGLFSFL
jgi:primosomal protein N'